MMLSYDQSHYALGSLSRPSTSSSASIKSFTSMDSNKSGLPSPQHRRIWIVTGPAGCGKSTIAKHLAKQFNLPFLEGDEFHPPANVSKMAAGIPLTDQDRWEWLIRLRDEAVAALEDGAPGVILACSALRHRYRDVIRIAAYNNSDVQVHFIYLHANEQTLLKRVRARKDHFMKDSMVKSQMMTLEEPEPNEKDVSYIEVGGSITDVQNSAVATVKREIIKDSRELCS